MTFQVSCSFHQPPRREDFVLARWQAVAERHSGHPPVAGTQKQGMHRYLDWADQDTRNTMPVLALYDKRLIDQAQDSRYALLQASSKLMYSLLHLRTAWLDTRTLLRREGGPARLREQRKGGQTGRNNNPPYVFSW